MADFCDFKKILSYRSVWMALAALWVVYHHISLTPPCEFLQVLKSCGAGGVDIFVFASGLGCYHSLKKNPDTLIFIKKRLIKIVLPTISVSRLGSFLTAYAWVPRCRVWSPLT